jgi:hypothetical protein
MIAETTIQEKWDYYKPGTKKHSNKLSALIMQ